MRRTIKDLLSAGKDATELMLDLAFASVFLDEDKGSTWRTAWAPRSTSSG